MIGEYLNIQQIYPLLVTDGILNSLVIFSNSVDNIVICCWSSSTCASNSNNFEDEELYTFVLNKLSSLSFLLGLI
ncbi:3423_t:CDS:2 [Entrophospora sp. SA101]|nr:3423_t:CDS:2 [Entrophospora sp. SA101]